MTLQKTIAGLLFVALFSFVQFEQNVRNEGVRNDIYFIGKSAQYTHIILEAAGNHNIHPALITAVIHAESNFNPKARSYAGAMGLMQINRPTARYLKLRNIFDPRSNILAGAKYLKELLQMFNGSLDHALAAYNAGPGAVKRYNGIPPYKETRSYVIRVKQLFDAYRGDV
jgi:soluble lytic murein transglycosylase-like protein